MTAPEFIVVYDILEQGLETAHFLLLLGFLAGVAVGAYNILKILRTGHLNLVNLCGILVFAICLVFWIIVVGDLVSGIVWKQWRCISWAKNGDFKVVVGHVQGYRRTKLTKWTASESFTVDGVRFALRDSDFWRAGFNKTSWRGDPFRAGQYTRISFREGCILKIEIVE